MRAVKTPLVGSFSSHQSARIPGSHSPAITALTKAIPSGDDQLTVGFSQEIHIENVCGQADDADIATDELARHRGTHPPLANPDI